jgi:hypothetical protein
MIIGIRILTRIVTDKDTTGIDIYWHIFIIVSVYPFDSCMSIYDIKKYEGNELTSAIQEKLPLDEFACGNFSNAAVAIDLYYALMEENWSNYLKVFTERED